MCAPAVGVGFAVRGIVAGGEKIAPFAGDVNVMLGFEQTGPCSSGSKVHPARTSLASVRASVASARVHSRRGGSSCELWLGAGCEKTEKILAGARTQPRTDL